MHAVYLLVGLVLSAPAEPLENETAADAVELVDGSLVRGQILKTTSKGGLIVLVRREWAKANLPDLLDGWERAEAPLVRQARRDRKTRLISWRESRASSPEPDVLADWFVQEIAGLSTLKAPRSLLTLVTLNREEVRETVRRADETRRLLRLGWRAGLGDVESLSALELKAALALRGQFVEDDPAYVDALLPLYPESSATFRIRRAATEVALDPALRFVQFRELILPETAPVKTVPPRDTTELIDSPAGRTAFAAIQGIDPADTVSARLAAIADAGRIGAVVNRLVFTVDSESVEVESSFWVRGEAGSWAILQTRKASATAEESDDLDASTSPLEETPIHSALLILESVASTPTDLASSRRRQALGSASQRALARASSILNRDLASYALRIAPARR